jgi:uncharacterized delta-60 repeat protein
MNNFYKIIIFVISLLNTNYCLAQSVFVDTTFNPTDKGIARGDGSIATSDRFYTSIQLQNGSIISAGDFNRYNANSPGSIVKVDQYGDFDSTFNLNVAGALGNITSLAEQSDGKIIISGSILSYNYGNNDYLYRIQPNGAIDNTFNIGTGLNNIPYKTILQPDGKIISVGQFSTYNGVSRNGIVRINSNGSIDTSFNPGTGFNVTPYSVLVNTVCLQPDGKIIAGGVFYTYNGITKNGIIRLHPNGSIDTTFNAGTGTNGINDIKLQQNGQIIIAGTFNTVNGIAKSKIARLNADGSLDTTFNLGSGPNDQIRSIQIQPDDKIIIGGFFTKVNNANKKRITRLNSDGSLDTTFNTLNGANSFVYGVTLLPNGKILVSGAFTELDNHPVRKFGCLLPNGSIDEDFNRNYGFNWELSCLNEMPNGNFFAAGRFSGYNHTIRNGVAIITQNGAIDSTFNPGYGIGGISGSSPNVLASVVQPDGKIIIGGSFQYYDSIIKIRLARLNINGSLDTSFGTINGPNNQVNCMSLQQDGYLILGGAFTTYNGITRNRIARVNQLGQLDNTFNIGSGANDYLNTIVIQPDSNILIGGNFTTFNGINRNYIARVKPNGSLDNNFTIGTGFNGPVSFIKLQPDTKILVGGPFTNYDGVNCKHIVRLMPNGNIDTTFNIGVGPDNYIYNAELQGNGKIIFAGVFNNFNNISRRGLARVLPNGSLDLSFTVGNGSLSLPSFSSLPNTGIFSMQLLNDGKLLASGGFIRFNYKGKNRIARLNICNSETEIKDSACAAFTYNGQTYNQSGTYYQNYTSIGGCDSTIKLSLKINQPSMDSLTINSCDSTTINGQKYYLSTSFMQQYTKANGCDSNVNYSVNINSSKTTPLAYTSCNSVTVNGQSYNNSGTYNQVFTTAIGCDSIIQLSIIINDSNSTSLTQSACKQFILNGQAFILSGNYTQTFNNTLGCDSLVYLKLTITNPNINISISNNVLTSSANNATYQWINCDNNQPIPNATNKTYSATQNGSFAVIVTQNGCVDTSECLIVSSIGIAELTNINSIQVYPNPSSGIFYINYNLLHEERITVYNALNQKVFESNHSKIDLSKCATGIYTLQIKTKRGVVVTRVYKQ